MWRPKQTGRSRPFLQPILEIFQVSAWDGSRGSHAYLQQRFLRSGDPANGPSADSQLPHFYGGKGRIEPAVYPRKSALLHRFAKDHGAFTVLGSWWQGRGSNPRPKAYESSALPLSYSGEPWVVKLQTPSAKSNQKFKPGGEEPKRGNECTRSASLPAPVSARRYAPD